MKNTVILTLMALFVVLMTTVASGQNKGQTQTFNYDYTHNYVVEWKEEDGKFNIKITKGEKSDSFIIEKELDNAVFTTAFMDVFKEVVLDKEIDDLALRKIIYQANEVRLHIKAQSLSNDDRPKAGDITISKEVDIIKFTEDWRLKCNRVKKCGANNRANADTISIYASFFEFILYLTKTPEEFEQNKATIRDLIQEIKITLLDMDADVQETLDLCLSYANNHTVTQLELNKLNASFEFYKNVYNKILEKNYTNSRTKCKQKERLANKKKNKKYYYKWKNVGTMCPSKQRKVHEIKKEREYLLDIDKKKEELNAFFEHYIHEHLEEKKKSLQGIEDTLSDLNKRQEKLIKSEEEVKSLKERVVGINGTIQKLKNSIAKDDSKLDTIQREIKKYELKKERFNLYILTIKELLRDKEIDSLWNYKNELDIKKFKQQPSNVRSNILEILDVWPTDTDSLSADDFSVTRCKTLKECKEYYSEELNNIEQDLKGLTSTKDSLEHSIENTKSRIEDFKKEQKDLNAAINKLESVPRFKYYNRLNNTKYFLYNKDEIKKEISNYKERKEKVKRNIEYLEALSQKLEQQKAAIEKESIQQKFIVDSIQIEFYEGFIENIWVRGHLKADKSRTLKFENRAPIGFSSKKAYDKNSTIWLTASDDDDAYWVLYMGELLTYLQHHENGTKDFSPANGTEEIKEFDKAIELRKQATFKILEAHVYSDFVGFNANSPNGLIQTEISKRFNLFTKRFGSFLRKDAVYCKCAGPRYGFNWGFGNFVRPSFVFSKFEDKERLLSVNAYHEIINGQLRSIKYVSTQDILQHEVFSVGALINVVTLDAPIQKSSLTLNAGFRFGRTELRDSVYQYKDNKISRVKEDNYGLNTVRGFLELDYRVTPQNRYGIGTSLRLVYMPIFTDNAADLYQYNRLDEYNDVKPNGNRWMVRFEASGFFKPAKDSDNKLFLRYRFHGQLNDLNYNFHQLQVGYSFYLLRNNVNVNKGTK